MKVSPQLVRLGMNEGAPHSHSSLVAVFVCCDLGTRLRSYVVCRYLVVVTFYVVTWYVVTLVCSYVVCSNTLLSTKCYCSAGVAATYLLPPTTYYPIATSLLNTYYLLPTTYHVLLST